MDTHSSYEEIAQKLAQNASSIEDPKMRANYFFKRLSLISDEGVLEVLNLIIEYSNLKHRYYSDILSVFREKEIINSELGEERLERILTIAGEKGSHQIVALMLNPIYKPDTTNDEGKQAPYELEDITIGERKSFAKTNDPVLIDKILADPEPMVIEQLLKNPRLTEKEVLKIVTKRPNLPEIIRTVSNSERWSQSYTIRDAIIRNPYSPLNVSSKLLPTLLKQDMEEVSTDGALCSELRELAKYMLNKKKVKSEDFYLIENQDPESGIS